MIAGVGYLDDRAALSAWLRLGVHLIAAILAVASLGVGAGIPFHLSAFQGVMAGSVLAVLAICWMTNLFNFMDGSDGIAASEAVFIASAAAWLICRKEGDAGLVLAMLTLAGATTGFLAWNWPPARIFMGDVGSGFLGFSLAALALAASARGLLRIEVWLILGGIFLLDATITLVRRAIGGEKWYEAHRTHAYQRLACRWNAHRPVTAMVIAIYVFWLLPWAWAAVEFQDNSLWCVAGALTPLALLTFVAGRQRQGVTE